MAKSIRDMTPDEIRDHIARTITQMDGDLEAVAEKVTGGPGETHNLLVMKGIACDKDPRQPLTGNEAALARAAVAFFRIYIRRRLLERVSSGFDGPEFDFDSPDFMKFGLL